MLIINTKHSFNSKKSDQNQTNDSINKTNDLLSSKQLMNNSFSFDFNDKQINDCKHLIEMKAHFT
jgi:hypothetical protein